MSKKGSPRQVGGGDRNFDELPKKKGREGVGRGRAFGS